MIDFRVYNQVGETICPQEMKSYVTASTKLENTNWSHRGSGDAKQASDLSGWASRGKCPKACRFWALNWKFKEVMDRSWWGRRTFWNKCTWETMQDRTQVRTCACPTLAISLAQKLCAICHHTCFRSKGASWDLVATGPLLYQIHHSHSTYQILQAVLQEEESYTWHVYRHCEQLCPMTPVWTSGRNTWSSIYPV